MALAQSPLGDVEERDEGFDEAGSTIPTGTNFRARSLGGLGGLITMLAWSGQVSPWLSGVLRQAGNRGLGGWDRCGRTQGRHGNISG